MLCEKKTAGQGSQTRLEYPSNGESEAGRAGDQQELGESQSECQGTSQGQGGQGVQQRGQLTHTEQLLRGTQAQPLVQTKTQTQLI